MNWAKDEWKASLSANAAQNVERLERAVEALKKEKTQRQYQFETLEAALNTQKRKTEEEKTETTRLRREIQDLCGQLDNLERDRQKLNHDLQTKEALINCLNGQVRQNSGNDDQVPLLQKKLEEANKLLQAKESELSNLKTKSQSSGHSIAPAIDLLSFDDDTPQGYTPSRRKAQPPCFGSQMSLVSNGENTSFPNGIQDTSADLQRKLDAQNMELQSLHHKLQESDIKLDALKKDMHVKERERERLEGDKLKLSSQLEAESVKCEELQRKLQQYASELECQRHNTEAMRNSLEERMKEKERRFREELSQQREAVTDMEKLVKEVKQSAGQETQQCKAETAEIRLKHDKLVSQLQQMTEKLKDSQQERSHTAQMCSSLEKANKDLAAQVKAIGLQKDAVMNELEKSHTRARKLEEDVASKTSEIRGHETRSRELQRTLADAARETEQAKKLAQIDINKLQAENDKERKQLAQIEADRAQLKQKLQMQEVVVKEQKESLNGLEKEVKKQQHSAGELRTELDRERRLVSEFKYKLAQATELAKFNDDKHRAGLVTIKELEDKISQQDVKVQESIRENQKIEHVCKELQQKVDCFKGDLKFKDDEMRQMKTEHAQEISRVRNEAEREIKERVCEVENVKKQAEHKVRQAESDSNQLKKDVSMLEREMGDTKTQNETLSKSLAHMTEERNGAREEIARITSSFEAKMKQMNSGWQEERRNLTDRVDEQSRLYAEKEKTCAELQRAKEQLETARNDLENQVLCVTSRVESVTREKEEANRNEREAVSQLQGITERLEEYKKQLERLDSSFKSKDQELSQATSNFKKEVTRLKEDLERSQSFANDKAKELNALQNENDILRKDSQEQRSKIQASESKVTVLEGEKKTLAGKVVEMESALGAQREEQVNMITCMESLKAEMIQKCEALQLKLCEKEEECSSVKKMLEESENNYQSTLGELKVIMQTVDEMKGENEKLSKEMQTLTVKIENKDRQIEDIVLQCSEGEEELAMVSQELTDKTNLLEEFKKEANKLEESLLRSQEVLSATVQEYEVFKETAEATSLSMMKQQKCLETHVKEQVLKGEKMEEALCNARMEIDQLQKEKTDQVQKLKEKEFEAEELVSSICQFKEEQSTLLVKLDALTQKVSENEKTIENKEAFLSNLQGIMEVKEREANEHITQTLRFLEDALAQITLLEENTEQEKLKYQDNLSQLEDRIFQVSSERDAAMNTADRRSVELKSCNQQLELKEAMLLKSEHHAKKLEESIDKLGIEKDELQSQVCSLETLLESEKLEHRRAIEVITESRNQEVQLLKEVESEQRAKISGLECEVAETRAKLELASSELRCTAEALQSRNAELESAQDCLSLTKKQLHYANEKFQTMEQALEEIEAFNTDTQASKEEEIRRLRDVELALCEKISSLDKEIKVLGSNCEESEKKIILLDEKLNAQNTLLDQRTKDLSNVNDTARRNKDLLESATDKIRTLEKGLEVERKSFNEDLAGKLEEINDLKGTKALLSDKICSLQKDIDNVTLSYTTSQNEVEKISMELKKMKKHVQEKTTELEGVKMELSTCCLNNAELKNENNKLKVHVEEKEKAFEEVNASLEETVIEHCVEMKLREQEVALLREEVERQTKEVGNLRDQKLCLEEELGTKAKQLSEAQNTIEEGNVTEKDLLSQINALLCQLDDVNRRLGEAKEKFAVKERELSIALSTSNELEKKIEEKEVELSECQSALRSCESNLTLLEDAKLHWAADKESLTTELEGKKASLSELSKTLANVTIESEEMQSKLLSEIAQFGRLLTQIASLMTHMKHIMQPSLHRLGPQEDLSLPQEDFRHEAELKGEGYDLDQAGHLLVETRELVDIVSDIMHEHRQLMTEIVSLTDEQKRSAKELSELDSILSKERADYNLLSGNVELLKRQVATEEEKVKAGEQREQDLHEAHVCCQKKVEELHEVIAEKEAEYLGKERDLLVQLKSAQDDKHHLLTENEGLKAQLEEFLRKVEVLNANVEDLRGKNMAFSASLSIALKTNSELGDKVNALDDLRAVNDAQTAQVLELETKLLALETKSKSDIKDLRQKLAIKENEWQLLTADREQMQSDIAGYVDSKRALIERLEEKESEVESANATLKMVQQKMEECLLHVNDLEEKLEEAQTRLKKEKEQSKKKDVKLEDKRRSLVEAQSHLEETETELDVVNRQINALREEVRVKEHRCEILEKENATLSAEKDSLEEELRHEFEEERLTIIESAKKFVLEQLGESSRTIDEFQDDSPRSTSEDLLSEIEQLKFDLEKEKKLNEQLVAAADDNERRYREEKENLHASGAVSKKMENLMAKLTAEEEMSRSIKSQLLDVAKKLSSEERGNAKLKCAITTLQEKISAKDANLQDLKKKNEELNEALERKSTHEGELKKKLMEVEVMRSAALKETASLRERHDAVRTSSGETEALVRQLKEENQALKDQLVRTVADADREKTEERQKLNEVKRNHSKCREIMLTKNAEFEQVSAAAKAGLEAIVDLKEKLKQESARHKVEEERQATQVAELTGQLTMLREQCLSLDQDIKAREEKICEMENSLSDYADKTNRAKGQGLSSSETKQSAGTSPRGQQSSHKRAGQEESQEELGKKSRFSPTNAKPCVTESGKANLSPLAQKMWNMNIEQKQRIKNGATEQNKLASRRRRSSPRLELKRQQENQELGKLGKTEPLMIREKKTTPRQKLCNLEDANLCNGDADDPENCSMQ